MRLYVYLLLVSLMMVILSACGASLQKPTGLEKSENEQEQIANDEQLEENQEPPEAVATEPQEDEEADKSEDIKVEQEKTTPIVKADQNEQEKDKTTSNEKSKSEPTESGGAGSKQPSKPVVDNKKPSTTKPDPSTTSKIPPAEKPVEKEQQPEPKSNKIVYSIVISSTEVPLQASEMEISDGDTVLKALIAITKEKKIQMDYRGGQGATAYIEGIDNVYEFDRGQGSGWMYRVNGIFPDRGAGGVSLMAGDRVEWIYTTNLGVDIGADLQPFRR